VQGKGSEAGVHPESTDDDTDGAAAYDEGGGEDEDEDEDYAEDDEDALEIGSPGVSPDRQRRMGGRGGGGITGASGVKASGPARGLGVRFDAVAPMGSDGSRSRHQ